MFAVGAAVGVVVLVAVGAVVKGDSMESKLELIEQLQNLLLDAEAVGYKLWQMQGAYEDTIDGQMMGHIYDADWCLNQSRRILREEEKNDQSI